MTILSCLIQGFLSLFSFIRFTQMSTANPLSFIVFVVLVYLYYQFTKNQVACRISPADKACSLTISILFSALALFSQKDMLLLNSTNLIEQIAIMVLSGIGLALILFYFLLWVFMTSAEATITQNIYPNPILPVLTFVGCILVWGFYFLHFYPGILPAATIEEFTQIQGGSPFSDQPSLIHAVLLDKILKLLAPFALSDMHAIGILTGLQILFLAWIAAYVIRTLQLAHIHTAFCVGCMIFYLIPYHAVMACTLSMDVLLAANLTGYLAVLMRLFLKSDRKQYSKLKWTVTILSYFVFGFMTCALSRVGLITFLLSLPFVLLVLREKWKITVPVSAVILGLVLFIRFPFFHLYAIEKPTWFSALHPALQAVLQHDSELSTGALLYEYLKQCSNIVFPGQDSLPFFTGIAPNEFLQEAQGILHYPAALMDTLLTMQTCIPIYGLFFSCGTLFWVLISSMFLCVRNAKPDNIALGLPIFILFLTGCVLSDGTILFHNLYSIFLALPLFVFLSFIDAESEY